MTTSTAQVFLCSRVRLPSVYRGFWGDEVVSKPGDDKTPRRAGGNHDGSEHGGGSRNVGDALRAVYQDAVAESVPDEMLDLLKKLG